MLETSTLLILREENMGREGGFLAENSQTLVTTLR